MRSFWLSKDFTVIFGEKYNAIIKHPHCQKEMWMFFNVLPQAPIIEIFDIHL